MQNSGLELISLNTIDHHPYISKLTFPFSYELCDIVKFEDYKCHKELLRRTNSTLVEELSTRPAEAKDLIFNTKYSQSNWSQLKSCTRKQWSSYWRTPDHNLVRFFFSLVTALLLGTIFWKVGTKRFISTISS